MHFYQDDIILPGTRGRARETDRYQFYLGYFHSLLLQ
jgi:hypothetical protein